RKRASADASSTKAGSRPSSARNSWPAHASSGCQSKWADDDQPGRRDAMYAAIRQFKAKPGSADALAAKIKEAISLISDVSGFMGYYVVYAPDDSVTAISVFNTVAEAQESNRRGAPPLSGKTP